jgi:hypothetical protein
MKKSNFNKIYHKFFIYLPIFFITFLIIFVYLGYYLTYLKYLLNANQYKNEVDFFLYKTSKIKTAPTKGKILLISTFFSILLCLISYFKTVITNPGYFPSPLDLEYKILRVKKNDKKNIKEIGFISKFSDIILENPLTPGEEQKIENYLKKNYSEELQQNPLNLKFSNEEIIEINKENYNLKEEVPKYNKFIGNTEVYLDIYKDIDISKITLCGTCLRFKVERSHHCRQCQKCILKMDHHCPWLANCIGFGNLKPFLLLQFYGIISCVIIAFSYWETIIAYNISNYSNIKDCWYSLIVYLLNIGLLSFLIWLALMNWRNLFLGQTIIEYSERERFPSMKKKNIYDMGYYRNFTNVFGVNPLVWFIPFFPNKSGNGYIFETNKNFYIK